MMVLEFKGVTGRDKKWKFKKSFKLKDINFALEPGYMMGLAGKNGAGKTTLVHYIIDEKYDFDGEILVDGKSVKAQHREVLDRIGFISEENNLFTEFTLRDNAKLIGPFYSKWDMALFEEACKKMELRMGMKISQLSRGQNMKFQLALAMAHRPKLYLIDEATAGMDPIFRKEFFRMLRTMIQSEEASVLLITHIEEELEVAMDYVGVMEDGRLISFETTL